MINFISAIHLYKIIITFIQVKAELGDIAFPSYNKKNSIPEKVAPKDTFIKSALPTSAIAAAAPASADRNLSNKNMLVANQESVPVNQTVHAASTTPLNKLSSVEDKRSISVGNTLVGGSTPPKLGTPLGNTTVGGASNVTAAVGISTPKLSAPLAIGGSTAANTATAIGVTTPKVSTPLGSTPVGGGTPTIAAIGTNSLKVSASNSTTSSSGTATSTGTSSSSTKVDIAARGATVAGTASMSTVPGGKDGKGTSSSAGGTTASKVVTKAEADLEDFDLDDNDFVALDACTFCMFVMCVIVQMLCGI